MGLSLPLTFLSSSGSRTNSSTVIRDFKSCWKTWESNTKSKSQFILPMKKKTAKAE